MFKISNKAAAVSLVLGAWAFQAQAVDLITLTSTDATTLVNGVVAAEVMLTVNAPFNLLSMDALLGYSRLDLAFQTDTMVYGGFTAAQIADPTTSPPGWTFNLADPLGASLSVVTDPSVMPNGLPIAGSASELLRLSFRGLTLGAHVVTLDLGVLDEATLNAGSFDPIHYSTQFTINVTAVPEPASYALLLGGLAVIGALARRRAPGLITG